jgi:hypothetical protein
LSFGTQAWQSQEFPRFTRDKALLALPPHNDMEKSSIPSTFGKYLMESYQVFVKRAVEFNFDDSLRNKLIFIKNFEGGGDYEDSV